MDVGIREAKSCLPKLVRATLDGEDVFLTNRGKRVAKLVPAPKQQGGLRGRGFWKGKVNLYPGWDSREEDKAIEEMFEDSTEGSLSSPKESHVGRTLSLLRTAWWHTI